MRALVGLSLVVASAGLRAAPPLAPRPALGRSALPPRTAARHALRCESGPGATASPIVRKLNSSTKWLVVLAQTVAVWTRRDFVAPFVVLGSILSTFATTVLKRWFNQQRPAGAPFADPGMPSSHALVSSFAAVAWAVHFDSVAASAVLLSCAALISVLRVVCGYHTWAQVLVGGLVGSCSAFGWMRLGDAIAIHCAPRAALVAVWALYLVGSAIFILKKMRSWLGKDAAL